MKPVAHWMWEVVAAVILLSVGAVTAGVPQPPLLEIVRADGKPQNPVAGNSVVVSVVVRNAGKTEAGEAALLLRAGGTVLQALPLLPLAAGAERAHDLKVKAPGRAGSWCIDIALEPVKGPGASFGKPRSLCLTVRAAKDGAAAPIQVPSGPAQGSAGGAAAKIVRIEQLSSKAQFKALADDTLLEIGGRKIRKSDFVAEFKRRGAGRPAGVAIRPAGLAAIQARLVAEEDTAVAASAAEVQRGLAEIRSQGGDGK